MEKKAILIVIDGMSDLPLKELNGKTPLEVATTPSLDLLAKTGICGLFDALGQRGTIPGSDTAHLAILGYDPYKTYTGRGPIEVAGVGITLKKGDVSLRCNYSTTDDDFTFLNRTAGFIREGLNELEKAIMEDLHLSDPSIQLTFRNSADYRCVLHLRGKNLSNQISDADPWHEGHKILEVRPLDSEKKSARTAALVNEFVRKSYQVLKDHPVNQQRVARDRHPANVIVPRGAGDVPDLEPFEEKWGLKGSCVAGTGLIKGIGHLLGMKVPNVPGATGYIDTDYMGKARQALQELQESDFVLLHIEGTDEVSHDGEIQKKIEAIEQSDKMIKHLIDHKPEGLIFIVLSDHTTSCARGGHVATSPPIVFSDLELDIFSDDISKYTERVMHRGMIGHIRGQDIMPLTLGYMNRAEKFGA